MILEEERIRWIILPFLAVAAFVVSSILGIGICMLFRLWIELVVGFLAAFTVVLITSLSAPRFEDWVGVITFLLGAIAAWFLIGDSFYPENYANPYKPTHIPIIGTYLGGLISVALCFFLKTNLSRAISSLPAFSTHRNKTHVAGALFCCNAKEAHVTEQEAEELSNVLLKVAGLLSQSAAFVRDKDSKENWDV